MGNCARPDSLLPGEPWPSRPQVTSRCSDVRKMRCRPNRQKSTGAFATSYVKVGRDHHPADTRALECGCPWRTTREHPPRTMPSGDVWSVPDLVDTRFTRLVAD